MKRVLLVSNGHGEVAIADRVARAMAEQDVAACDHLALVGDFGHSESMRDVGPRRKMPSGGLLAMGNLRNIARDVRAGLLGHTLAQLRFLRGARGTYDAVVAVGDVFALAMALRAGVRTIFAGTAKSVYVAPYGPFEERLMRKAFAVFVRDDATAQRLKQHGIAARSANVIVDLYARSQSRFEQSCRPRLALFPGSREEAYDDAVFLCEVVRTLAQRRPALCAMLSIAPGLDVARMEAELRNSGWRITSTGDRLQPFNAFAQDGRKLVRAWCCGIGPLLGGADLVLGQAGTANEAAAAAGIPVVAFTVGDERRSAWYRRRQAGLLGGALLIVPGGVQASTDRVDRLLNDPDALAAMSLEGRRRMGPPGGASRIAASVADAIA